MPPCALSAAVPSNGHFDQPDVAPGGGTGAIARPNEKHLLARHCSAYAGSVDN